MTGIDLTIASPLPVTVVALGRCALLQPGEPVSADGQRRNAALAAAQLAAVARDHRLVITHGSGHQIGVLALQSELEGIARLSTLDILDAETEGMVGYIVEQELGNALRNRRIATLLTQVEVDPDDPAFDDPTKPIGPVYTDAAAQRLVEHWHWKMARAGTGKRRVVPSPEPRVIVEMEAISALVDAGVVVICAGGGGIPVVRRPEGLHGIEAVLDKDRTSALLAERLGASRLVLLTDVPGVMAGWGTTAAEVISAASTEHLRAMHFEQWSMGTKVDAACRFVERTGGTAAIGSLLDAEDVVAGRAGTSITPARQLVG